MAMIAMTTSNSMRVKPRVLLLCFRILLFTVSFDGVSRQRIQGENQSRTLGLRRRLRLRTRMAGLFRRVVILIFFLIVIPIPSLLPPGIAQVIEIDVLAVAVDPRRDEA